MYINKWNDEFRKSPNQKVLLMLSGGKDSSACLHILINAGIDVTAIHFTHRWGYSISTNEARKLCGKFNIPLIEVDFSKDFYDAVISYKGGRPCLLCKPQMYKLVIDEVVKNGYGWICIGDNADDRTTIVRCLDYIKNKNDETLYCSTYFGSERGIMLPSGIKVLRPLLDLESLRVEEYLRENGITIDKNHCTGDKYFEYSREGCPIQFNDPGYELTEINMNNLHKYNLLITSFAREKSIKASIHLPSTFIITIPTGYEVDAGRYLESYGLKIDWNINSSQNLNEEVMYLVIKDLDEAIFKDNILEGLFERMFERLELKVKNVQHYECETDLYYTYDLNKCNVSCRYIKNKRLLSINFISEIVLDKMKVSNLVVEIFRTRNYKILNE